MGNSRRDTLDSIVEQPDVDVLVIGGGVNGIGTFRDLALNGLRTLLVEKGDFCSGASAASSHMAHGGIRYLENGEFRLVHEAVRERNRLLQNAPHIVHPLPTTIPIYKIWSGLLNAPLKFFKLLEKPSERGAVVIKIGLMLYDAFTGKQRSVPKHRFAGRKASLASFPTMNKSVLATATYYDGAIMLPERLGMEMVLDTEATKPFARAINYMEAAGARGDQVVLKDNLSGKEYSVRPRVVVNAAGPWIDLANLAIGRQTRFIGGTKGSHLVLDHPELRQAVGESEIFFENEDGRIVLIFPWFDRLIVGTSDIRVEDMQDVRCTGEEVDYFLSMIANVFPDIEVTREQIVFRFSGVRPLPYQEAASTGQISRDHQIRMSGPDDHLPFPVLSLVGGKWTTFRAFSEQATDKVLEYLKRERTASTRNLPIGGGHDFPGSQSQAASWAAQVAANTRHEPKRVQTLLERYGTTARAIARYCAQGTDLPLEELEQHSSREIGYLVEKEKVVHLDDLLLRRTPIGMLGRLNAARIAELGAVAGGVLGWDADRLADEIRRTHRLLAENHAVILE